VRKVLSAAGWMLLGVVFTVLLYWPSGLFAQGPAGFTKVGSATSPTTTYSDATVTSGGVYQYAITAVDSSGRESIPSNTVTTPIVPSGAGTHHANLGWSETGTVSSFNVYRFLVPPPSTPTGLTVAVD
jgi:hypothetical protein